MKSVRLTLTHQDMNVLMDALDSLDEDVRNFQGAADPYRAEIDAVEQKIQAARARMRSGRVVRGGGAA